MKDKDGKEYLLKDGVLNIGLLERVICKCGHDMMHHYYGEGWCEKGCGCKKFEQTRVMSEEEWNARIPRGMPKTNEKEN